MTNFDDPQYRLASAIDRVSERVRELEAFDNAIFQIKTTTGRPASRGEFHFCINTFDSTVELYSDGAWRDIIGGGGGGYTDEDAQDAIGTIWQDTASTNFTYDDVTPEMQIDVIPGGVDHDLLLNYDGNEHFDHTGITLTAGDGLSGGGTIAANRTFDVDMLGIEDLAAPAGDRILFYDDTAGKTNWLNAGTSLSFLGTDLNVDDDFVSNSGDSITGDLTYDGAFHPIIDPGSDTDGVLIQVTVTGTPALIWDESEDSFSINKGLILTAGNFQIKSQNELRFYDNGNYVGFEAPALSADQIWVLPDADGAADEFLQTDGAGNLDWAAGGGGSGGNCWIETGTYTGDGTTSQVINLTDTDLEVKYVTMWNDGSDGTAAWQPETTDLMVDDLPAGMVVRHYSGSHTIRDNEIIAVGTGTFTVDDGGGDDHPNQNNEIYNYIVLGTH